ncbi:MAG: hypothetical protein B6D44_10395 [Ignavibacteriales bacterium UTCHB2]|jgi:hypothetical protein|nr:MAG: hypothetical protein BWY38_02345 [Ignavibacteria bacterium ADurb.Bin266]OQY72289.1 MAG: hypothetical protein B6D44_10395 [Ignavibacteriales bacterium UTCHB2]HQI41552.1 tail fiber domain-containing protein [Ignavibacteriaceae bacterium]
MKNILSTTVIGIFLLSFLTNAQNITNTLPPNGSFKVKDNTNDFLSIEEATGNIKLYKDVILPDEGLGSSLQYGNIFKGGTRFIHTYHGSQTAGRNTFVGLEAGNFSLGGTNYEGSFNTGIGSSALYSLTTGLENSALGFLALFSTTSGSYNAAFGVRALTKNTTGEENSAFGYYALNSNTTGNLNTAVGSYSLSVNTTGFQNTAVGHHSLQNNNGNYNTAIGYNAGSTVTTGVNLTLVGIDANPSSPTATDQITLGNQFVQSLRCNVQTITSLSDVRDKKNIEDLSVGLDFITKLKPRQFNWDRRDWYQDGKSDGSKMQEQPTAGFIAQELDEVQISEDAEWLNLVLKDNPEKWEATYGNLLPVIVKAVQELNNKNEQLKAENKELAMRLLKYEENQTMLVKEFQKIKSSQHEFNIKSVFIENNN